MELVAHEFSNFDAAGNLTVQEQSISVKATNPKLLTAAGLKNAVKRFLKSEPQYQFDDLRIRYKDAMGKDRATTLKTNDLDAAFTRKETVELSMEVDAQQSKLSSVVVAALEKLL